MAWAFGATLSRGRAGSHVQEHEFDIGSGSIRGHCFGWQSAFRLAFSDAHTGIQLYVALLSHQLCVRSTENPQDTVANACHVACRVAA